MSKWGRVRTQEHTDYSELLKFSYKVKRTWVKRLGAGKLKELRKNWHNDYDINSIRNQTPGLVTHITDAEAPSEGARGTSLTLGIPWAGDLTRKMSPSKVWFWKLVRLILVEPEDYRNWKSTIKGLSHSFPPYKTQHRASSLKSTWAICEDLLSNFRAYAREAGISRNFIQEWQHLQAQFSCHPSTYVAWHWWAPVLTLSTYPAGTACPSQCCPVTCPTQLACPSRSSSKEAPALSHPAGSLSQTCTTPKQLLT